MRYIALDTETTGLNALAGDRIIELGAIVFSPDVPYSPTMPYRRLWARFDPERPISKEAMKVHGIKDEELIGKGPFSERADEIGAFLTDSVVVMHNAPFDEAFINAEFAYAGRESPLQRCKIIDTLELAKKILPGMSHKLTDLCQYFGIDPAKVKSHSAVGDSELTAQVYQKLRAMGAH